MGLTQLQVNLITGAINMSSQKISDNTDAIISRQEVFMVSSEDVVDLKFFREIAQNAEQSVPVYYGRNRSLVIGTIKTQSFLALRQLIRKEKLEMDKPLKHYLQTKREVIDVSLPYFCSQEQLLGQIFQDMENKEFSAVFVFDYPKLALEAAEKVLGSGFTSEHEETQFSFVGTATVSSLMQ